MTSQATVPQAPAANLAVAIAGMTSVVPAIDTAGLRKEYGRKVALHDLSLTVWPGEVFGFLGPNGAGKTTTVKILTGLVSPTSGTASVFGVPVDQTRARSRIGYLPELFRFHDWFTGYALLDFHARLAGLTTVEREKRIPEVLSLVGLADRGADRLHGYSKGMLQRIGIAQALIHGPDLVLLDEPTSALDPIGRREVRDLIRRLRDEGVTVFLNSHLLSEIELVCDRVAIVDRGRVVRSGRMDELVDTTPTLRLTLDRVDADLISLLERHGRVRERAAEWLALEVADVAIAPAVAREVVLAGYLLYGFVPAQPSLEDAFVTLVESRET